MNNSEQFWRVVAFDGSEWLAIQLLIQGVSRNDEFYGDFWETCTEAMEEAERFSENTHHTVTVVTQSEYEDGIPTPKMVFIDGHEYVLVRLSEVKEDD